jgi:hypothetical protein
MVLLVEAAKAGDYAEVEAALARGDDVNATDEVCARWLPQVAAVRSSQPRLACPR